MKKISSIFPFILIALALTSCLLPAKMNPPTKQYALTTKVVALDEENDLIICKDFNGNLWKFYGCEDWAINDIASLLMSDEGTEKIYDDTILGIRYNGYFEGWN